MSKALQFIAGSGSQKAVVDAASKVLSQVGVSLKETPVASVSGVAVGSGLCQNDIAALKAHSAVLDTTTAALNPDATFSDSKFTLVRAFAPNPEGHSVAPVDRVDKFAKSGINTADEVALLKASFAKTAALAVKAAADMSATKITVLTKPQTAFKEHNALFLAAVKASAEETGVSVEVQTSQQVTNNALMFTKNLGVVVSPDYTASDNFEAISAGIAGGNGLASKAYTSDDATVHVAAASGNPTALLVSAARALKASGDAATAAKIEAGLQKAYAGKVLPADVQGGSADAAKFASAISC